MRTRKKEDFDLIGCFLFLFILSKTGFLVSSIMEYVSLLIFSLLVVLRVLKSKTFMITKPTVYYLLFGGYVFLSYFWAMNKDFALETIYTMVALVVFMIVLSNYIYTKEKLRTVVKYLVLANVLVSGKILLFYFFQNGTAASRIISITGIHFNTVGQVIAFSTLFSVYLYRVYKEKKYLYAIVPQLLAIVLTTSRKSLLIPIIGMIIVLLLEKRVSKLLKYLFLSFTGMVIFYLINPTLISNILEKLGDLFKYAVGSETTDWSINLRDFFIQTGEEIFKHHPMIGIGVNNFAYYVGTFTSYGIARYSHNNYIELLSCLGIVGFMLYYWLYLYLLVKLRRRASKNNPLHMICFSILITLIIMEWGIVSYTGCMYHMYLLVIYYTLIFGEDIVLKKDGQNG
ncbi:MAG: O-antigen ligase family protein [bacterium]|nr:O-antigen ligase family protein [bacterium]